MLFSKFRKVFSVWFYICRKERKFSLYINMNNNTNNFLDQLKPPESVKYMKELDKEQFNKTVQIPALEVQVLVLNKVIKSFKKYILKIQKLKPVKECINDSNFKLLLINPAFLSDIEKEDLTSFAKLVTTKVDLTYDNWTAEEILKAVLPDDQNISSFSLIGHILHVNLKDYNLPYKNLIGEVYLDKVANCSLVVNKLNTIDNTFRTFSMEILAGEGSTITTIAENGVSLTFDFAKVYWNSRLATEHGRIVSKIDTTDMFYDVMAGVGPFSIPVAKKKNASVFANDLNPESFKYLVMNSVKNKVDKRVACYNLDGHEFIKTVVKNGILKQIHEHELCRNIHIAMNLPALAVEFLPTFVGLISEEKLNHLKNEEFPIIIVHVYMFCKDTNPATAIDVVFEKLGFFTKHGDEVEYHCGSDEIDLLYASDENQMLDPNYVDNMKNLVRDYIEEVVHIRNVAPNKQMMRVSLKLTKYILFSLNRKTKFVNDSSSISRPNKLIKTS